MVAHAEVDSPVRLAPLLVAVVLLVGGLLAVPLGGARAASPAVSGSAPFTGNVSGPTLIATVSNATFHFNASGGSAFLGSTLVGTIKWTARLNAVNTTGCSVTPANGTIANATDLPAKTVVKTGNISEAMTLTIELTASLSGSNASVNLTASFHIVVPYAIHAVLVAGSNAEVLPFLVSVALDGKVIGTVAVPELAPKETYALDYRYATLSLSSGYHTFTLSITEAHGLVSFSNGRTVESATFYVAPAPANNTLWYVVALVAFFGVLFIYATRVAARRRGTTRR